MQEEVTKHTKKIFKTTKNSNFSFSDKAKEITIEIFIIVFAVTISIYFHSWSQHRHEQKQVKAFLTNLKEDLTKDVENLENDKSIYLEISKKYKYLLNLTPFQLDSLKQINFKINFPVQAFGNKINNGNFEGFKSSGKIGFIENEKLKKLILTYYQQIVPNINEIDNIYNQFLFKALDSDVDNSDKTDKEKYLSPKFRQRINYLIFLSKNNVRVYDQFGIKSATEIIEEINKELKIKISTPIKPKL